MQGAGGGSSIAEHEAKLRHRDGLPQLSVAGAELVVVPGVMPKAEADMGNETKGEAGQAAEETEEDEEMESQTTLTNLATELQRRMQLQLVAPAKAKTKLNKGTLSSSLVGSTPLMRAPSSGSLLDDGVSKASTEATKPKEDGAETTAGWIKKLDLGAILSESKKSVQKFRSISGN